MRVGRRSGGAARALIIGAVVVALLHGAAWAEDAGASGAGGSSDGSLLDALEGTRPLIDVRLRSERVGQLGKAESAEAVTVRGRFGFETGSAWGTSLLAEGVALTPLDSDYSSTLNGKTQYPTVADPETYALNRLQLRNTSIPETVLIVGRSRISLDDQRFVGSSNWRQLEQTFDAVQLINGTIPDVTLDLTYLDRVNRVYGRNSPQGTYRGDNYLANASVGTPVGKLVGFAYLLDFDIDPNDSTQTYGVRFAGDRAVGPVKVGYSASYATQHERANNPLRFHDDYWEGQLSGELYGMTLAAGAEVLGGDGVKGFTTPLATLHPYQGWAEQFLTHPANGIDDRYASIGYGLKKALGGALDSIAATAVYHDFHSRLGIAYGSEIDGMVKATWRSFALLVEYADYAARRFSTDTRKLWVELDYVP
jgi:hypothetical protein